jgi:ribosomal protein L37AE/L43A
MEGENQKIRFCPQCGSEHVRWENNNLYGSTGIWICGDCGFTNPVFPEKGAKEKVKKLIKKQVKEVRKEVKEEAKEADKEVKKIKEVAKENISEVKKEPEKEIKEIKKDIQEVKKEAVKEIKTVKKGIKKEIKQRRFKKVKVLGVSKNERRSEYVFPKEQDVFEIVRRVLVALGFENDYGFKTLGRPYNERTGRFVMKDEVSIKSRGYRSKTINFSSKRYFIEVIFSQKNVVLRINYNKDEQQRIAKLLDQFISEKK